MAGLFRILNSATLVVHLMVGCCLHHALGCETQHYSSGTHCDTTLDGQCPQCRRDHSHHGTQDCQGGTCSFVSPRRTVGGSFIPPHQASFVALPIDQSSHAGIGTRQRFQATGRLLLPVRLHLANQVLLI